MIEKSVAKSRLLEGSPSQLRPLEMQEECNICGRSCPDGVVVLRKKENDHIICLLCLVEIAEVAKSERP